MVTNCTAYHVILQLGTTVDVPRKTRNYALDLWIRNAFFDRLLQRLFQIYVAGRFYNLEFVLNQFKHDLF